MPLFGKGAKLDKGPVAIEGDDLGPYPSDIDDQPTQSRVLERALRNLSIATLVSGMMNIGLIMLIIAIFPLQKVQPYLVTFKNQDNQVVAIEPMAVDAPGILYMTEDNVRDYVTQRHQFVPVTATMEAQWGDDSRLAARTDKDVFAKFSAAKSTELQRMMSGGYTRQIEIESVNRLNDDTWQVNFKTHDSQGGEGGTLTARPATVLGQQTGGIDPNAILKADLTPPQATRNWVATMRVAYKPDVVTYDKRLLNPLGFTVTDYSVTSRS